MDGIFIFPPSTIRTSRDDTDCIGKGTFGEVRHVYHKKLGEAAVKIFRITGTLDRQQNIIRTAKKEADILVYINHEYVVRCHGVVQWSNYFAIIMDYINGGTLHDLLHDQSVVRFPLALRFRMMHELSDAMRYLHNSGNDERVVHSDLKSSNIFVTSDLHIRVGDFGAASLATKTSDRSSQAPRATSSAYTIVYAAPEFLTAIYGLRTTSMDIYSLGMVLYEIVTRLMPFCEIMRDAPSQSERARALTDAIGNGQRPDPANLDAVREEALRTSDVCLRHLVSTIPLIIRCWSATPSERPKIEYIENHFSEIRKTFNLVAILKEVTMVVNQRSLHQQPPSDDNIRVGIGEINL